MDYSESLSSATDGCQTPIIAADSPGGIILFSVIGGLMAIVLLGLSALVHWRKLIQPLRLKSASLLTVVVLTNAIIVIFGTVIQIGTEVCSVQENCTNSAITATITMWLGIIVLAFCEPLAIMA